MVQKNIEENLCQTLSLKWTIKKKPSLIGQAQNLKLAIFNFHLALQITRIYFDFIEKRKHMFP